MNSHSSLIGRLIRWQTLAMGLAWSCLLTWLIFSMVRYEGGDLDQRMTYFAQILAETASSSTNEPEKSNRRIEAVETIFAKGIIEKLGDARNYAANYQVFNSDGQLIYRSKGATQRPYNAQIGFSDLSIDGQDFRAVHVQSNDKSVSVSMLEASSMRRASMVPLISIMSISQVLIFLVCLAVLWWVARVSFRPLKTLALHLRQRQPGDLSPLNSQSNFSEIAPLIQEVNALFSRETRRLEKERNFLADAAHELRTPLSAIGMQAHLLIEANTENQRQLAGAQLKNGLERTAHLIRQLLVIARADATAPNSSVEPFDIAELTREQLVSHVASARKKSIEIQLNSPEALRVAICKESFTSILDNLVDNAVKYTPHQGIVSINLKSSETGPVLAVKDTGPGIQAALHERVFERFYRVPGTEPSGSGLGLPIVAKLAQKNSATVLLRNRTDANGLEVTIQF
jgi:signal transduction histidine kinase